MQPNKFNNLLSILRSTLLTSTSRTKSNSRSWLRLRSRRHLDLLSLSTAPSLSSSALPMAMYQMKGSTLGSRDGLQVSLSLSEEEQRTVLRCLNSLDAEEMRRVFRSGKTLSSTIATEICKHREENGSFSSLEDVAKVKKVGRKTLSVICENLRKGVDQVQLCSDSLQQDLKYFTPTLAPDFVQTLTDVTSIEVCIDAVYFATVTKELEVTEWNHMTLLDSHYQKQTSAEILEQAHNIVEHLPTSSLYVMESRMARRLTPSYMQLLLFVRRLQMAIQALVNVDLPHCGQHNLFHVKDSFTMKAFDLRVGGERVSSQNVIQCIEEGSYKRNVEISPALWRRYHRQTSDVLKERYASSLLVSLGVSQHILCQDAVVPSSDAEEIDKIIY